MPVIPFLQRDRDKNAYCKLRVKRDPRFYHQEKSQATLQMSQQIEFLCPSASQ